MPKETTYQSLERRGYHLSCRSKTTFSRQRGPTCGLFTIQNALEGYGRPIKYFALKKPHKKSISLKQYAIATRLSEEDEYNLSILGEIYSIEAFVKVAQFAGLSTNIFRIKGSNNFYELCVNILLKQGRFLAVPVSNAILKYAENPGTRPHWILIIGILDREQVHGTRLAYTTAGKLFRTRIRNVCRANMTIHDRPLRYKRLIGKRYVECNKSDDGAIEIRAYPASRTLANRVVVLW